MTTYRVLECWKFISGLRELGFYLENTEAGHTIRTPDGDGLIGTMRGSTITLSETGEMYFDHISDARKHIRPVNDSSEVM